MKTFVYVQNQETKIFHRNLIIMIGTQCVWYRVQGAIEHFTSDQCVSQFLWSGHAFGRNSSHVSQTMLSNYILKFSKIHL